MGTIVPGTACWTKNPTRLQMNDDTLLKLRKWESEIKAKNLAKETKEAAEAIESLAEKTQERLKDGLDAKDIEDTVRDVEKVVKEVSEVSCGCWGKKPVTTKPGPGA